MWQIFILYKTKVLRTAAGVSDALDTISAIKESVIQLGKKKKSPQKTSLE